MLPRKNFENLHTAMAILVLFKHFLGKVCSYFWPQTLSASQSCILFAQFRLCVLKATAAYGNEKVRNYGKNLFIQNIVENGWCGDAYRTHNVSTSHC